MLRRALGASFPAEGLRVGAHGGFPEKLGAVQPFSQIVRTAMISRCTSTSRETVQPFFQVVHGAAFHENGRFGRGEGHPPEEVFQGAEGASPFAFFQERLQRFPPHGLELHQPHPDFPVLSLVAPATQVYMGPQHFQPHAPRFRNIGPRAVIPAPVVDDRRHEFRRVVRLEIGRFEAHQGVGRRVGLAEGISRKRKDHLPDASGHVRGNAPPAAPV